MRNHACGLFFSDDSDTSLMESEPHSPKTPSNHMRTDPNTNDDDNDGF
jgi:hypothetical protein